MIIPAYCRCSEGTRLVLFRTQLQMDGGRPNRLRRGACDEHRVFADHRFTNEALNWLNVVIDSHSDFNR